MGVGEWFYRPLNRAQRWFMVCATAVIMVLDSVTTWLAVQAGAHEMNPFVRPWLAHPIAWLAFTALKTLAASLVVVAFFRWQWQIFVWTAIMAPCVYIVIINAINAEIWP